jgi:hypothetical protein
VTLPLPVHDPDEEDGPHLYTKGPITPRWAQRVKKHQHKLMRSLRGGSVQNIPAQRGALPLPRSINDLRHTPGKAMQYTTPYKGVSKRRWHPGYAAYVPPGYGLGRRKIGGIFPTEEAAALAVLQELNPNAFPNPTGDPS